VTAAAAPTRPVPGPPRAPARLAADDVARFGQAMDAAEGGDQADRARAFRDRYLRPGTPGLRDWARLRLAERPGTEAEEDAAAALARAVAARPRFYAAIRGTMEEMARPDGPVLAAVRAALERVDALLPGGPLPDVYLVVGRMTSAGCAAPAGVLLGAEMFARGPDTPLDELSPWERAACGTPADLPGTVAHEVAHARQPPLRGDATLLALALREGAADFVAALAAPPTAAARARHAWGDAHEAALWAEFVGVMHGRDGRGWLYQGDAAGGRPADLGYYLGYRVCQAYHSAAADPAAALRRILSIGDPDGFLRESRYAGDGPRGGEDRRISIDPSDGA
jgi:hypothetical protein